MLINERTAIHTSRIILVPYSDHHVTTYHQWMQDEELRELTASDPLTLEEEYAMQRSWRRDADKLTFILCLPGPSSSAASAPPASLSEVSEVSEVGVDVGSGAGQMVGDVNLFLSTTDDDESGLEQIVGELELMVAEKSQQGKGLGKAGLLAFLKYISNHREDILREYCGGTEAHGGALEYLRVRINEGNKRSIGLFESLWFTRVGERANYFGEVELRLGLAGSESGWIDELLRNAGVEMWREAPYLDGGGLGVDGMA